MQALSTDFPPEPPDAGAPWCSVLGVGGALVTTFALGFTEGCLEIERRPIPLRFALRFAAANVLPSVVFRSFPARHAAAASGIPLSSLINDADLASTRSVAVGKRLVLIKSVRALRLAAGSYGLAWSLWHWHKSDVGNSDNNANQGGIKYGESVVRLAPVDSPLSRASKRKHGDHILTVPSNIENREKQGANRVSDAVNWKKVGINICLGEEGQQVKRVKVIEVEIGDAETTADYARGLKAKASTDDSTSVCSVAVLPLCGPPIPPSAVESYDVCFNPLSAVLRFIAFFCHERGVTHVILAGAQDDRDEDAEDLWLHLSMSQLANGLLYRHGITSSVLTAQDKEIVSEDVEGELTQDHLSDNNSDLVFLISKSLGAAHFAAEKMSEQGRIVQENACFIVEESLSGRSVPSEIQSELLRTNAEQQEQTEEQTSVATYMSVTDVTDQTLQGIRNLLRQGNKPDAIQAAVYRAFGTQRVVAPTRLDQFSDMHI
ncbi:hypothetical protein GN244_ATG16952 [Phytophthora infestans]|uniref:Uncharacterized protein n=1 Tax=Phytophthora infestans TaxID=4787 RepID=A0A833SB85_PHYIN|nr:hypothetical protein GN244_ATG16952 [Phytophthora infestans]KAF4141444.1 hypothetical protein GN958_ATG09415 [Phytophthora infestans]